jgi:biopolymer transport protein ExbD
MSKRKKAEAAPEVVLPITPMLDMAFQLLVFFIFTYHPSALEGQMEMALPTDQEKAAAKPEDVDPFKAVNKDQMPDMQIELKLVVEKQTTDFTTIVEEGVARSQPFSSEQKAALIKHLKGIFKNRMDKINDKLRDTPAKDRDQRLEEELKKLGVSVQGSANLKWGDLVQVMDAARVAGFVSVSCAPPIGHHAGAQ